MGRIVDWLFQDNRFITEDFFKKEREKVMAKKVNVVKFTSGEYKPKRLASGLIGLRAPINVTSAVKSVNLNMSCDVPLLINGKVVNPGEDIVIDNPPESRAGDVFARAYPLLAQDFEVA
jgi:hypothetical protein